MKTILKQKKYSEFRNYEIVSNGVKIEFKTHEYYNEQIFKFEDIGFEEEIVQYKPSPISTGLFISVLFNIILVSILLLENVDSKEMSLSVLSGVSMGVVVGLSLWARKLFRFEKLKFIKGEINLSFWYFEKYQNEVNLFIENLKEARKEYFRDKYLNIDENENVMFVTQKINWLKSMQYITEAEYQEWLSNLSNKKVIKGF